MSAAAATRRRRQFKNGQRHLAKICGKAFKGGRRIYPAKAGLSVSDAIAKERAFAARQQAMKGRKKK
jgi:hypothetical protein